MFDPSSFDALLGDIPPEALEQMLAAGTLDERGAQLQQQMAQAEALRTNNASRAHTGIGAALSGAADMLNAYSAKQGMQAGAQGLSHLSDQKDALRRAYVEALRRGGRAQPGALGEADLMPAPGTPNPFGMG